MAVAPGFFALEATKKGKGPYDMELRNDKLISVNGTPGISLESPKPESQEFATARLLIEQGFHPTETVGMVRHISTGRNLGRTLGSVWRAMHLLLDSRKS